MTATSESLQEKFAPPLTQNWTRHAYHASALVGDFIYMDAGEVAIGTVPFSSDIVNPRYNSSAVNCTLSIPVGKGWTDPSTVKYSVILKPTAPTYNFAALWYDSSDDSLYSFGGEESYLITDKLDLAIYKLELNGGGGGTWYQNTSYGEPPFTQPGITRPFGGASTQNNNIAWYLGGYSSSHSSPQTQNQDCFIPTPGLVEYHFDHGTWANSTIGITNVGEAGSFEWGGLEYVPFGPNGLLVIWGGETSNATKYTPGYQERPMNQVTLLDPITKQWYQQNTTGTAPSPRNRFCIVGVADPRPVSSVNNTGTYEIFMYAGYSGTLGAGAEQYDEVWVLSLPAFNWQRVDASQKSGRIGHTCHLVGQRQLLSIGGVDAGQTDAWSTPDYSNINGLGVFDLVELQWTLGLNASAAPYQRSMTVQNHYDQNGAYPSAWTQSELENLIVKNVTTTITPSITPTTVAAATSINPSKSSNILAPSTRTAVIAGTTTAGAIALFLPLFLLLFYLRRKSNYHPNIAEFSGEPSKHELADREKYEYYRKAKSPRFVVELDAGSVAKEIHDGTPMRKGGNTPTPRSTPASGGGLDHLRAKEKSGLGLKSGNSPLLRSPPMSAEKNLFGLRRADSPSPRSLPVSADESTFESRLPGPPMSRSTPVSAEEDTGEISYFGGIDGMERNGRGFV